MESGNKALARFLEMHGLERYAELLAEHEVDLDILPGLSHDALKELGLSLGDRRKLLAAASELERVTGAPDRGAERRHVTVLFCDVVGASELVHRLDPEDFSDLLRTYSERTAAAITRYDGHVAKHMGDVVLAVFGYPQAHEDDAERAVLAALDLLQMHGDMPVQLDGGAAETLQVRIGIHTGQVVVGSFDGGPGSPDDIFGEAPNVAQRLLLEAGPEEILVSPQTCRQAGTRFEFNALEPRVLRGLAEPIAPRRVLRADPARTRFETRRPGPLTPLIGRAQDIGRLLELWAAARAGAAQVVTISGPPGVGKSRLAHAFCDEIRGETDRIVTLQCSPFERETTLYPVVAWLRQEAGLSAPEPASETEALQAWLSGQGREGALALVGALLSVGPGGRPPSLETRLRRRRDEALRFLTGYLCDEGRSRPLLLLVEDIHWADSTTLRLLQRVRSVARDMPMMMIATSRPGSEQDSFPLDDATHLRLDPLPGAQMAELVTQAAMPRDIDAGAVRAIVERSDGLPLFAEELTETVLDRTPDDDVSGEIPVPDSLAGLLCARLDALPHAKHLAQIAAVIGREVPQPLLQAVSGYDEARFRAGLRELAEAGMIVAFSGDADEPLVFGETMMLEVAQNLMLRRDRRRIEARVAEERARASGETGKR